MFHGFGQAELSDGGSILEKKSLISNTDFLILQNNFLKICPLEMVILNLIFFFKLGLPPPPGEDVGKWGGGGGCGVVWRGDVGMF